MNKNQKISRTLNNKFASLKKEKNCVDCNIKIISITKTVCDSCLTKRLRIKKKEQKQFYVLLLDRKLSEFEIRSKDDLNEEVVFLIQECINNKFHSSWSLSEKFNIPQRKLYRMLVRRGVKFNRTRKSSVAHFRIKAIIENLIDRNLETEKEFRIGNKWYYADEYDSKTNTVIEVDGAWCHTPEKDAEKENFLLTHFGVTVIRIDSKASEQEIKDKIVNLR